MQPFLHTIQFACQHQVIIKVRDQDLPSFCIADMGTLSHDILNSLFSRLRHLLHGSEIHSGRTLATGADGVAVTPDCGACAEGFSPFDASKFNGNASGMR